MEKKPFKISERIKSFEFAFQGVVTFFKTQHNAWVHVVASILAIILGFVLKVDATEWCWMIVAIAMVFIAELFNTSIEFLTDLVSPQYDPLAKKVKDVAAAGVLIAAIAAVIIGLIVFVPKILIHF